MDTSDDEQTSGAASLVMPPQDGEQDLGSFVPQSQNLMNQRRLMTAPEGASRKRYAGVGLDGGIHQCFVESDLMKAANIYQ